MTLRLFALAASFSLGLVVAANADDDMDARLAAARDMMEANHSAQTEDIRIGMIVDRAKAELKEQRPGIPDPYVQHYGDVLREELARDTDRLLALRARYYAEHFSAAELKDWTVLLRSPAGQAMLDRAPDVMRDMYGVDGMWLKNAYERTMERLAKETDGS